MRALCCLCLLEEQEKESRGRCPTKVVADAHKKAYLRTTRQPIVAMSTSTRARVRHRINLLFAPRTSWQKDVYVLREVRKMLGSNPEICCAADASRSVG